MKRPALSILSAIVIAAAGCTSTPSVPSPTPNGSEPVRTPSPPSSQSATHPATAGTATSEPTTQHRIGVREAGGFGEFFDRVTDATFTPRGNNLIRLDTYHDTFDPRSYNASDLDQQLTKMAGLGYNVVRVFLDHRVGGLVDSFSATTLSDAYLDNMVDFLRLARAHGVYVMFTQDWLPESGYPISDSPTVSDININYLTPSGVSANAAYFRDLASGLIAHGAPLDAIWSYELRNELFMVDDHLPFSLSSGSFAAPDGRTYDLADPTARRVLLEDGIVYWVDAARSAILEVDPTALVSVGFFVPQDPNPIRQGDNRIVETREVLTQSTADFVDVHGYPGLDLPLPKHLQNFGLTEPIGKPVVMGEMGGFHSAFANVGDAAKALISWQADSCAFGFDGWMLWTWDTPGEIWSALDAHEAIGDALAPANRPDPCSGEGGVQTNLALGQTVRTSAAVADSPGSAAVDGSFDTLWSSGDYATQWIEVQLSQPLSAGTVTLVVSQYPDGHTTHRVYGRASEGSKLVLLHTFNGDTHDSEAPSFDFAGATAFRYVRIETVRSPSWVAWREIEVNPAP